MLRVAGAFPSREGVVNEAYHCTSGSEWFEELAARTTNLGQNSPRLAWHDDCMQVLHRMFTAQVKFKARARVQVEYSPDSAPGSPAAAADPVPLPAHDLLSTAKTPPRPRPPTAADGLRLPSAAASLAHRVLLGSILAEFLGPLTRVAVAVNWSIFPWLLNLQDKDLELSCAVTPPPPSKLTQVLSFLEAVLDTFELQELTRSVFARAALCGMQSCMDTVLTGSRQYVRLAAELMKRERYARPLLAWDAFLPNLERLLLVVRPPSHKLKNLLPIVRPPPSPDA